MPRTGGRYTRRRSSQRATAPPYRRWLSVRRADSQQRPAETELYPPMQKDSKPERERQEVGHIHQRNCRRRSNSEVVDPEIEQFGSEGQPNCQKNAFQLAASVELARQKASQR